MKISALPIDTGAVSESSSILDTMARKGVYRLLQNLHGGTLRISDSGAVTGFGENDGNDPVDTQIIVHHPSFYRQVASRGSIGAGESYAMGLWSSPNLTAVIRLMCRNLDVLESMDRGLGKLSTFSQNVRHRLSRNSITGAKKNIHAHYDLSNELFGYFLDSSMMYSSAMYNDKHQDLESAARHKLQRIGEKLDLTPDCHVVEIGTGWGGLATYLAENFGCQVTTTTISEQQYEYAQTLVEEKSLNDRVTVLNRDYRQLEGAFDRLVSVEMIEAVGHQYMGEYFATCDRLLKPGGRMVLQAITIPEQRFENYLGGTDFIQRYIFPGGCLPSVESILHFSGRNSDLQIQGLEDIGLDYARTLADWYERFVHDLERVRAMGFDDRFIRLWQFYLCYCEGGFLERAISTAQIEFRKPDSGS